MHSSSDACNISYITIEDDPYMPNSRTNLECHSTTVPSYNGMIYTQLLNTALAHNHIRKHIALSHNLHAFIYLLWHLNNNKKHYNHSFCCFQGILSIILHHLFILLFGEHIIPHI